MPAMKTFSLFGKHPLHVGKVDAAPAFIAKKKYTAIYEVRSFDAGGVLRFYVGTGYRQDLLKTNEVHVWYLNGRMWHSFGTSIERAIAGAAEDAWRFMEPLDSI